MIDRSLLKLLGKRKIPALLASALLLFTYAAELVTFFAMSYTIRQALAATSLNLWIIIAVASALCALVFGIAADLIQNRLGTRIRAELRDRVLKKTFSLGGRIPQGFTTATLTQLSTSGIESLDIYFSQYFPTLIFSLASPILTLALLLAGAFTIPGGEPTLWIDAVILVLLIPLIPVSIILVSRFAKRVFGRYWGRYLNLGNSFVDALRGLKDLKDFSTSKRKSQQLTAKSEEFRVATMKVLVMQLWSTAIMDTVAYGGAAACAVVGVIFAIRSSLSPDSVAIALFSILTSLRFFLPLRKMGSLFHIGMNGATAGRSIIKYLGAEEPVWGDYDPEFTSLKLEQISYTYRDERTTPALHGIQTSYPATGLFGIVGPSGSGKSTLAKILSGAIRPSSGQLKIADIDIGNIDRTWFYTNVAYLDADPYILSDSILNLFRLYCPGISDSRIEELLDMVELKHLYEDGRLERSLKENASDLSGGERQRLALALTLSRPRKTIIVDEAISAVDAQSSRIICSVLKRISSTCLVLIITHAIELLKDADRISILKDGRLITEGKYDTLTKKGFLSFGGDEL